MSAPAIQPAEPGLDERTLRTAFGRFATGVAFVTTEHDGLIVSSVAAVSLRPPLISFCPSRDSLTWQRMRHAGRFAIHVLDERSGGFARRAAVPGADRLADPYDALATLECELADEHVAGDHWIVVGRVLGLHVASGRPLVYYAGGFGRFEPCAV